MSAKWPAQPLLHSSMCPDGRGRETITRAQLRTWRHLDPVSHRCLYGHTFGPAVETFYVQPAEEHPEHDYELSMSWPGGAPRPLCMVCHGDHLADDNPYLLAGRWAPTHGEDPR